MRGRALESVLVNPKIKAAAALAAAAKKTAVPKPGREVPPASKPTGPKSIAAVVAGELVARSKTKKKKRPVTDIRGREQALESYWEGALQTIAKKTGNQYLMSSEQAERLVVGIPFDSLAQCALYKNDVQVLGRCMQIVGLPGSAKTLYMYDMMRLVMSYGGLTVKFANEGKDAPDLRNSVFHYNKSYMQRTKIHPTFQLEEWMEGLSYWISLAYKQCDPSGRIPNLPRKATKKGAKRSEEDLIEDLMPGIDSPIADIKERKKGVGYDWTIPYMFGIDSLMSTPPRSVAAEIAATGSSRVAYAIAANLLSTYCKTLPMWLGNNPILIVGTNHLKPGTDANGYPTVNIPGGKAIQFMETYRLQMTKISSLKTGSYGGIKVKMQLTKNSLGETGDAIMAQVLWRRIAGPDGKKVRQYTEWDWHTATTELLLTAPMKKRIKQVVDLNIATGRTVWSKALGIPRSRPVSYHEAGRLIDANADMLEAFYPMFGISRRKFYNPAVPFRETLARYRDDAHDNPRHRGESPKSMINVASIDARLDAKAREKNYIGDYEGAVVVEED